MSSKLTARYILTNMSPSMFGTGATIHIKLISAEEARSYVDETTQIVATRITHERLARNQLPGCHPETSRFASFKPGTVALNLHYRGAPIGDDGEMPLNGVVSFYLIETEEYQEHD